MSKTKLPRMYREPGLMKTLAVSFPAGSLNPRARLSARKGGFEGLYSWCVMYRNDALDLTKWWCLNTRELRLLLRHLAGLDEASQDSVNLHDLARIFYIADLPESPLIASLYSGDARLLSLNPSVIQGELLAGHGLQSPGELKPEAMQAYVWCLGSISRERLRRRSFNRFNGRKVRRALAYIEKFKDAIRADPLPVLSLEALVL